MQPWILIDLPIPWQQEGASQKNFFPQRNYLIQSGGMVDLWLYPSGDAGEETLSFRIVDQTGVNKQIDLEVLPAKAYTVALESMDEDREDKDFISLDLGEAEDIQVTVQDIWWNTLQEQTSVEIGSFWPLTAMGQEKLTMNIAWTAIIKANTKDHGGRWYIYAKLQNESLEEQLPWLIQVLVQESFMPTEKLNVMYLNLFGADRWSIATEKNIVNELFGSSEKLLAMSTQFVSPSDENLRKYRSVESSPLTKEDVWFLGDMTNITQFAAGQSVGQSTKGYQSPWMINIGDPLLSLKKKNETVSQTDFDAWAW